MSTDEPNIAPQTKAEEEREAKAPHTADRGPTPDEEKVADAQKLPEGTAEHYSEMTKTGAEVKGEGEI
jgi:hypothetical protein